MRVIGHPLLPECKVTNPRSTCLSTYYLDLLYLVVSSGIKVDELRHQYYLRLAENRTLVLHICKLSPTTNHNKNRIITIIRVTKIGSVFVIILPHDFLKVTPEWRWKKRGRMRRGGVLPHFSAMRGWFFVHSYLSSWLLKKINERKISYRYFDTLCIPHITFTLCSTFFFRLILVPLADLAFYFWGSNCVRKEGVQRMNLNHSLFIYLLSL